MSGVIIIRSEHTLLLTIVLILFICLISSVSVKIYAFVSDLESLTILLRNLQLRFSSIIHVFGAVDARLIIIYKLSKVAIS